MMSEENHKSCKYDAIRTIEKISYLLQHLKNMKNDECPALFNVEFRDFDKLDLNILEMRRGIKVIK